MKKNKCDELGLAHAWKDITPNIVYPTYPPTSPPKREMCQNCGLERWLRIKTKKEWIYDKEADKEVKRFGSKKPDYVWEGVYEHFLNKNTLYQFKNKKVRIEVYERKL